MNPNQPNNAQPLDSLNPAAVTTDAGLIVPATAVTKTDKLTGRVYHQYDPDGRRRVVLTHQEQKKINQVIQLLASHGFGIVVTCQSGLLQNTPAGEPDQAKPTCGKILINEDRHKPSAGYGCACSRIHFVK